MTNKSFETVEDIDDVEARNFVDDALKSGEYNDYDEVRPLVETQSRDNTRSPMQWTDADQAGFTDGEPWTAVNRNSDEINVAAARDNPDSVWHYYRDLIDLRADCDALVYGDFEHHESVPDEVFAYTRTHGDERLLVVTNLGDGPETVSVDASEGEPIVSNYADPPPLTDSTLGMRPYEAVVYDVS